MNEWSGGFGPGGRPPNAKIPVKVHRSVSLVRTADQTLTYELLSRPKLSRLIVGQLCDDVLLVVPEKVDELVAELKKIGHTPRIVSTS
ncbi:hypothetical protein K2X85_07070 [bacterium]|nr:hypothetical protein [bacterium]